MKRIVVTVLALLTVFLCIASDSPAQETTATFSGRVVDAAGHPVPDLPVLIGPVEMRGAWVEPSLEHTAIYPFLRRARTDAEGRFSITGIPPAPAYFRALPDDIETRFPSRAVEKIRSLMRETIAKEEQSEEFGEIMRRMPEMQSDDFEPDVEVVSIQMQGLTFHPRTDFDKGLLTIVFSLQPGIHVENVVVTVQPRMRIRGRIVFKDGTPLANARVSMHLRHTTADRTGSGSSGREPLTDSSGYFAYYLDERDDAAFYTLSAEYQGIVAVGEPVLLEPGGRYDDLVLTLDSEPTAPEQGPSEKWAELLDIPIEPPIPSSDAPDTGEGSEVPATLPRRESRAVWIGNPANGHAYRHIYCKTREDALAQAAAENVHLLSINNEEEQRWIEAVFGRGCYWLGLRRVPGTTDWQWDTGEPITYHNWLPDDYFDEDLAETDRQTAVMTFAEGKWYAVGSDSIMLRLTRAAILEKLEVEELSPDMPKEN